MEFITWSDDLALGIDAVDMDHQMLVGLINQLHDAIEREDEASELALIVDSLTLYCQTHFDREELMMRACGYGDFARHRRIHTSFSKTIGAVNRLFRSRPDLIDYGSLLDFLKDWLERHIKGTDRQYLAVFRDNGALVETLGMRI